MKAKAEKAGGAAPRGRKRASDPAAGADRAFIDSGPSYGELVAQMPNGVLVHRGGKIVFVNDFILSVLGCRRDEIVGRSVLDFVLPADRGLVEKNMALRLAHKEAAQSYEARVVTRRGECRTVVIRAKRIDYEGQPAVLAVLVDVTEKKHSEKVQGAVYKISEAAQTADDLPELIRSVHRIICGLMRAENFYVALYDEARRQLSFPYYVDEFDAPPDPCPPAKGLTEYVLRTGSPLLATPEIVKDLEERGEVELIGAPSIDWLGVPLRIREQTIGVLVVQTYSPGLRYGLEERNMLLFVSNQVAMAIERKRAEAELRRSEQKNRAVLSAMPDLMFLFDRDGVFLDYKAEKDSQLLVSPKEFLGRNMAQVLPPWLAELTMKNIRRVLETKELQVYEYELNIDKGTEFFEARCVLCGSDEVLVVIRNLTERRRLEQQVLQAQKMESLGTLAGGIAHDFNNILAGILGYASFLKSTLGSGSDVFKYVDTIERSAARAADLTSKLLAFTRGGKADHRPLDINKLVLETLEIIRHTIDKSIVIEPRLDGSLPTVLGDAGQVQQVVMNLCVNARDAMPGGGRLAIASETAVFGKGDPQAPPGAPPGSYVKLVVSDTGSGMDPHVLPRIFDPFFTTKTAGQGSGLGLSVVYGIVKGHDGFITVGSQPGQGSRFSVFFPASGRPEARAAAAPAALRGNDELVLVVDDEEDICSFIGDVLRSHGYRVLLCHSGEQALQLYEQRAGEIDLVILDMVMPGLNGEETFLKMKALNPAVRALLSTGFSQNGRVSHLMDQGVKAFIQKPYDFIQLLAKLRQVLQEKG
jgi:PAS domain S-box-containing protein